MMVVTELQSWSKNRPAPERWWAFYVRVTREESVTTDLSIPNQVARAKEVAALRGWHDYKIYVEPKHVSAELWTDKRPALKTLLDDVRAGRVLGLCARHADRLWRNNDIQSRLLGVLRPHKVELWDFAHQYDYRSAHGRFSLQVLGAASELEVNLTAERIREMKRGKALKGKTGGGPPPFGYTSQSRHLKEITEAGHAPDEAYRLACLAFPIGKCWYVDEKEAEIVRLIFELYTSPEHRYGSKRVGRYLNERGYKTRQGCAWLSNYVNRIINNPAYAGFTSYDEAAYEERLPSSAPRYKQTLFAGVHPPLIPPDVWRQVQAIKTSENTVKRARPGLNPREIFSLTGILRCPNCGCRMIGKWSHHSTRRYYICSRRHTGGPGLCAFPLINALRLQREVWAWLHGILTSPQFLMEHVARLSKELEEEAPESEQKMAALERRQSEIKGALTKYYALFESSQDLRRDDALLDRVRELKAELQAVEADAAELRAKVIPFRRKLSEEQAGRYLEKLRAKVDTRPEYQRALFYEFKRQYEFEVHAESATEFVLSLALPSNDLFAEEAPQTVGSERLFTVVAGASASRGSGEPGSPLPGGPIMIRLCAPAAAISIARRAVCCPRTSARSTPAGPEPGSYGGGGPAASSARPSRRKSATAPR
jgi:site-specific DNA recombinase